ncbi:MAG TPA: hypothetical protein VM791_16645 [Vicinamibacterales bacterium]|jgi:hypothetical protein|nr:hypothetical protein [Vicinamibacterales bacterium]
MRTVIVRGQTPLPEALRDVIERGSTSVHECRVPGPTPLPRDVDRVVYYLAGPDADVVASARQAVSAERRDGSEKLVYVMGEDAPLVEGLAPTECFRWPADADRLKMAFMTSA